MLTKAERGNAFSRVFGAHISRVALVLSAIHSMQPMWQHVEVFQNGQADDILLSVRDTNDGTMRVVAAVPLTTSAYRSCALRRGSSCTGCYSPSSRFCAGGGLWAPAR